MFDARTAERARPGKEELHEASRSAAPWRLPDGRRVWSFANRLEADAADGGVEILEARWDVGSTCGLGFEFSRRFYDLTRRRFYDRDAIGLRRYSQVRIRSGRWLVRKSYKGAYELLDPDSREFTPAAGIEAGDWVCAMLDDSRVIVRREKAVLLVDPVTGVTVSVPAPAGAWVHGYDRCRTPDGRQVFLVSDRGRGALARFDPATATFAMAAWVKLEGYRFLLGCPTDDEAIVHDGSAIWRLHFGSDEREEIWRVR